MRKTNFVYLFATAAALIVGAWLLSPQRSDAQANLEPALQTGVIGPQFTGAEAAVLPAADQEAMIQAHLLLREVASMKYPSSATGGAAQGVASNAESDAASDESAIGPLAPSDLLFGRNNQYTLSTGGSSTAEPAAANDGPQVFYSTNWSRGFSLNGGVAWTSEGIPGGPTAAPLFCCDQDVVHDLGRGKIIWTALYLNSPQTVGDVRIFVRNNPSSGNACFYDVPSPANTVPDYPRITLTNDNLILTTNNLLNGNSWTGSQVWRFNLDQLTTCATAGFTNINWVGAVGQRVFKPAHGGREAAYWGAPENSTSFRVFRWLDSAGSPTNVLVGMATSNFTNPDCRGGNNNVDFVERNTAWGIFGFTTAAAVGRKTGTNYVLFYWNVGPDTSHPQGHVHGIAVNESGLTLVANVALWNGTACWAFPGLAGNSRGDIGIAAAFGGRAGGGGGAATAARPAVGISDEFVSGVGAPPSTLSITTAATDNISRYGDFLSVFSHTPCDLAFSSATYALNAGVTRRMYTEFLRRRDNTCYADRRNTAP